MNIWRLMANHIPEDQARVIEWSRTDGAIAIGWGGIGDYVILNSNRRQLVMRF